MNPKPWEWCEDHWHDNYDGAPKDGSAWLEENDNHSRLLRGGSWFNNPRNCRSASCYRHYPFSRYDNVGFRVAVS
ncbi:MAG: SUMF1/EgtB/PvdO family nonheme iron enzyme [Symploca sp. SIO2E6]|nr:SUMF1/EgtB/PvdO family nonheme iron enzyme [Symploca sp. SIO2E6]